MRVFPVVTVGAALALTSCTADYATRSSSPVILLMTGLSGNQGSLVQSDVLTDEGTVLPDTVSIRLENHSVNPNAPELDWRADIVVERYEVRYFRSDGRGTEGVDVPYRISGYLSFEIIYRTAADLTIEVVRRQAKVEPPLVLLVDNGRLITMMAEVTLHGRTNAGAGVSATGRIQINAANFAG